MRDVLVTLLICGTLPFIFWRPYIGILVWSWISYMNPHRLSWGFAYDMPFAAIVAVILFAAMLLSSDKYRLPRRGMIWLWLAFILWMSITTVLAIYPDRAVELYSTVIKIQAMTLVTIMLINTKEKLQQLIWVIVCSIGFYSFKGGLFTLVTGGGFRVYGPPSSNIQENNALAVATLMLIPLMVYLYKTSEGKRWVRIGLGAAITFSMVSVLGSQSRGALLAIAAVGGFFWLKTDSKILSGTALVLVALTAFTFMPDTWRDRMATISDYQQDASAMGRINAWKYSINIADDRLTGGGFNSWSKNTYRLYSPDAENTFVAHSIYFAVLADHGWPGLALYLIVLILAWRTLGAVISMERDEEDKFNPQLLAKMLKVSLIAYLSGGAFLSLSYFDLPWHIVAISVILGLLCEPGALVGKEGAETATRPGFDHV